MTSLDPRIHSSDLAETPLFRICSATEVGKEPSTSSAKSTSLGHMEAGTKASVGPPETWTGAHFWVLWGDCLMASTFNPLTCRVLSTSDTVASTWDPSHSPWAQHRFPSCEALPIPQPPSAAACPRTRAGHPVMDGCGPLPVRSQHVWSAGATKLTRPWT